MKRRISIGTLVVTIMLALSSSVALAAVKFGTEGRDLLFGTSEKDVLYGSGGEDGLLGRGAEDVLDGGGGDDYMFGGAGGDVMNGGDGEELLGLGPQFETDGGEDVMHGGDGNDDIVSFDVGSRRDIVSCGGGKDRAFADFRDRVADDCEKVFRRRG